MKTFKTFIVLSFLLILAALCSCGKSEPPASSDFLVPFESTASLVTPSVTAAETSTSPVHDEYSDAMLLQSIKSGRYHLLGSDKAVYCVQLNTDLWFEFFIAAEEPSDSTVRRGSIAVKDGYLYALCRNTNKLFVFKVQDDHTLIFSANKSNSLTISGHSVKDGDTFVWEDGETVFGLRFCLLFFFLFVYSIEG